MKYLLTLLTILVFSTIALSAPCVGGCTGTNSCGQYSCPVNGGSGCNCFKSTTSSVNVKVKAKALAEAIMFIEMVESEDQVPKPKPATTTYINNDGVQFNCSNGQCTPVTNTRNRLFK